MCVSSQSVRSCTTGPLEIFQGDGNIPDPPEGCWNMHTGTDLIYIHLFMSIFMCNDAHLHTFYNLPEPTVSKS